eukprot:c21726_g1_i1 orf=76-1179(+)
MADTHSCVEILLPSSMGGGPEQRPPPSPVQGIKELVDCGLCHVPEKYVRPPHERPCMSAVAHNEQVPVIDISGLFGEGRSKVVDEIGQACEKWGFFQVINHGVPRDVVDRIWAAAREFFGLPADQRMRYYGELLSGKEVSYFTSHLPEKEKFSEWKDSLYFRCHPAASEALELAPGFLREPVLDYLKQTWVLGGAIYGAILESLGLSSDCSVDGVPEISSVITAIHYYPTCPDPSLTFGQSRHSDITLITLLLQDDVGGLQVLQNDRWVAVNPVPDSFVINVGDPVQILSNAKYRSVEHRIVINKEKPRMSIPCFFNPSEAAMIGPLEKLLGKGSQPLYKEIVYGDYAKNAMSKGLSGKWPLDFAKV